MFNNLQLQLVKSLPIGGCGCLCPVFHLLSVSTVTSIDIVVHNVGMQKTQLNSTKLKSTKQAIYLLSSTLQQTKKLYKI